MEIKSIRKNIAALQSERREIERQPRGRMAVAALVEGEADTYRSRGLEHLRLQAARVAAGQAPDLFAPAALPGLVALLLDPKLIAAAVESVPVGMASDARAARLAAIAAELDRLETDEEKIVCETGAERRVDCRAEIVLAAA